MTHGGKISTQEMMDNQVPLHVRDDCAGILIPLNKCRRANFYAPWQCKDERHEYEICLYEQYELRRQIKKDANAAKK